MHSVAGLVTLVYAFFRILIFYRRIRVLLWTEFNAKSQIIVIYTLAILEVTYSFNLLNLTFTEKKAYTKVTKPATECIT